MSQSHDTKVGQSYGCRQTHAEEGRLGSLVLKDGSLHLPDSDDKLPQSLIKALEAAGAGPVEEAVKLLNHEAVEAVNSILEKDPSRTDAMLTLAMMFKQTNQLNKAKEWFEKILKQEPHPLVYNELGYIYHHAGSLSEAVQYYEKAIEADPDETEFRAGLARVLIQKGEAQNGIELFRQITEARHCNAATHSSFLFYLHYLPELDPQMLFDEHRRWGRIHALLSRAGTSHNNVPNPDRRLRVGYISPDFCTTSQAYNFEPLLDGHDHEVVELYGYGNVVMPGSATERLKQKFDHYRNIYRMGDEAVVRLIEQDRIDILVELGGHVGNNRLAVLAYKPAPIQVDYLGNNTTGMEAIDYRLTNVISNPPQSQQFYTEELVFLPESHLCYRPQDSTPPVAPLPALRKGYITFGSFNNSCKINPRTMALWAEVLKANSGSRLLLKFGGGVDRRMSEHYFRQFEHLGINRERVAICGWKPATEHLLLYGEVDVALDTYPYNGCVTTLEGMWMGVPVISLVGECFVSREGLNILNCVGLEFFAATTPAEYVAKATALAANLESLAQIRASMRQRMVEGVLCDGNRLARRVEAAYRKMWRRWCQDKRAEASALTQTLT